jgi:hypothetical protein
MKPVYLRGLQRRFNLFFVSRSLTVYCSLKTKKLAWSF